MTLELPCPHALLERLYPDEYAHQRALDAMRRAVGLTSLREFPCPGTLSVDSWDAPVWVVRCDRCMYLTSCRNPQRRQAASEAREGHVASDRGPF